MTVLGRGRSILVSCIIHWDINLHTRAGSIFFFSFVCLGSGPDSTPKSTEQVRNWECASSVTLLQRSHVGTTRLQRQRIAATTNIIVELPKYATSLHYYAILSALSCTAFSRSVVCWCFWLGCQPADRQGLTSARYISSTCRRYHSDPSIRLACVPR